MENLTPGPQDISDLLLGHCSNKCFGSCWYCQMIGIWQRTEYIVTYQSYYPCYVMQKTFPGYLVSFIGALNLSPKMSISCLCVCGGGGVGCVCVCVVSLWHHQFTCTLPHPASTSSASQLTVCFIPAHTCSVTLLCYVLSMLAAFCQNALFADKMIYSNMMCLFGPQDLDINNWWVCIHCLLSTFGVQETAPATSLCDCWLKWQDVREFVNDFVKLLMLCYFKWNSYVWCLSELVSFLFYWILDTLPPAILPLPSLNLHIATSQLL